jgi:hypothetical protein
VIVARTEEDLKQLRLLASRPGQERSGQVRYAAAMYFHGRDMMGDGELEAYRICSPLDHESPVALLRSRGHDKAADIWLALSEKLAKEECHR